MNTKTIERRQLKPGMTVVLTDGSRHVVKAIYQARARGYFVIDFYTVPKGWEAARTSGHGLDPIHVEVKG